MHAFGFNSFGITDRFDSTNGVWWQLAFDEQNRVRVVHSSNGSYQYSYGAQGEIIRFDNASSDGRSVTEYYHDGKQRITGVYSHSGGYTDINYAYGSVRISGPEMKFGFDFLPSGKVAVVQQDKAIIRAMYDEEGSMIAMLNGSRGVEFGRNELGLLSDIRYSNGERNRYHYDKLGNRAVVEFGMGGSVQYSHDPAGNIVEVKVTERNGEQKRQTVQIGDMNRVERIIYEGMGELEITYDRMGREKRFDTGRDVIVVEYVGPDQIRRVSSQATGTSWSPSDQSGGQVTLQRESRRDIFHGDRVDEVHPNYGVVDFDEGNFQLYARDPLEIGVPHLQQARNLIAVAESLFSNDERDAMMSFEKPSNPVFQPFEYRSTNCCVCIITYTKSLVDTGNRPGSILDNDGTVTCICSVEPPPPYRVGHCERNLMDVSVPEEIVISGFRIAVSNKVRRYVDDYVEDHHDVMVVRDTPRTASSVRAWGFYPVDLSDAIWHAQAVLSLQQLAQWGISSSYTSFVDGEVRNASPKPDPADCELDRVSKSRYDEVLQRVRQDQRSAPDYSLLDYHCQHWVADILR